MTDAAANAYATYGLPRGSPPARVGQAVVTVLAIAALVAVPRVRPWLRRGTAPVRSPRDHPM